MSETYIMNCGIHQGGYLSLVKYTAYINSLITKLELSNLCSEIYRVRTSPVGYADDIAASTISKQRMDRVMSKVYEHGCEWRFKFNASKSAVLVFGETERERGELDLNIECSHWGANVSKRDYIMITLVSRRVLRETPMLGQRKK